MFNGLLSVFTFVGGAFDGFYGNRSDYYLCAALRKVRERFPPTTDPRNHLLQRALRKSYLEATLLLCNSRLKELQPSRWRKFLTEYLETDAANPSSIGLWSEKLREKFLPESGADRDEILWLCNVVAALNSERIRVDKSDEVLELSGEYELFLQPRGTTVETRINEMRGQLQKDLLSELERTGAAGSGEVLSIVPQKSKIPERIGEMVEKGWIPYNYNESPLPLDDGKKLYWFECFCGFFQQKLTGEIADVFQNRLLVSLRVGETAPDGESLPPGEIQTLDFKTFQNALKKLGKSITKQLDGIEKDIAAFGTNQTEIKGKLDELLPLIMTAEDISAVVKGLPALIRQEGERTRQAVKDDGKQTRDEMKDGFQNLADKIDNRRTETGLPSNLRTVQGFVGREEDLKELRGWFNENIKSFVLHGFGGVGKSAIADYFAKELEPRFAARIYIEMRGAGSNPMTATGAMFEAVKLFDPHIPANLTESDIRNLFQQFVNQQPTLIVLDNAKDRAAAEPLNHAGACVIVTSRESFTLAGGKNRHIEKMLPEDARKLLFSIAGEPRFDGQADTLAGLAGYIPMALQPLASLLAENVLLNARQLITRYADRKERLRLADPNLNNLTVEASLDLSYEALTGELKERWRQLAVFPADFELNGAASVWRLDEDLPTATETLVSLARYSLIEVDKTTKRCEFHDLARDYAHEKLTAAELADAQFCHARYYQYLLSQSNNIWQEKGYQAVLDEIDREWHNILQGQKWSADNVEINEHAAEICISYSGYARDFIPLRLHPRENIDWLETGLSAARKLNNRSYEGISLSNLGNAYNSLSEYRKAIEYHEQALNISREIGSRLGEGQDLGNLGNVYHSLGEYRKAIEYYEQSLNISREIGNRSGEGNSLGNLGNAYNSLGEYRKAIEYHEQSLNISREIGDRSGEGISLSNLGNAYYSLDEYRKAIEYHEQSLKIKREIGNRLGEGISLGSLGLAYYSLGEYRKAIEYHEQSLKIKREIGNRLGEGNSLGNLGLAYKSLGEYRKAIEYHEQSLNISREIGDRSGEGISLGNLGNAYNSLGEKEKACGLWKEAVAILKVIESPYADVFRENIEKFCGNQDDS